MHENRRLPVCSRGAGEERCVEEHTHSQPAWQVAMGGGESWAHTPGPTADSANTVTIVVSHNRFKPMMERC